MLNSLRSANPFRTAACVLAMSAMLSAAANAQTVIVNDADAGFSIIPPGVAWSFSTTASAYNQNYRYKITSANPPYNSVQWQPTLTSAGNYEVAVWYPTGSLRPNNAVYTVHHSAGATDVTVDQTTNGGQWVSLGSFTFAAGTGGSVSLSDHAQANRLIMADAVRFRLNFGAVSQYRVLWADVFHEGFKNAAQVDALVARALTGGYNVILPEVMAYQDNALGSHGAYWRSDIVPTSSVFSESFDPLGYLLQQAHAAGLQVHPWLVAFRVSNAWPPAGNTFLKDHPEYFMVPFASKGNGAPVPIGGDFQLDPGSPGVQEYMLSIVKELATRYEIDGVHWDYIRYTDTDAGYPSVDTYTNSSLARFKRITGYQGTPPVTGEASWDDFRTRTITEIIRRVRAEIADIASNPRQPLRQSGSLITWGNAPSDFDNSSAHILHQNWREWLEKGYFDFGVPMCYYNEGSYYSWYRNWVNAAIGWAYDRHIVIGPAIYLNSFADSLTQIRYAEDAQSDGICTYSYGTTTNNPGAGSYWDWYPFIAANEWPTAVPVPTMPWRDPLTATEGTLYGRVLNGENNHPIDNATVQAGALSALTDGNGYYVITLLPASGAGTAYDVTATADPNQVTVHNVVVPTGGVKRQDLIVGVPSVPPIIAEVAPDPTIAFAGQPYEQQLVLTQGTADTWSVQAGASLGISVDATGFVNGWTPTVNDIGQSFTITIRATNVLGSDDESWLVEVHAPPPCLPTVFSHFEGFEQGAEVLFQEPDYSGSTRSNLDPDPESSGSGVVSTGGFLNGQAYQVRWTFVDDSPQRWLRITTYQVANVPNPTVWLDKPIHLRVRLDSGSLRICLGIRETGTNAAIGTDGGTSGPIEWIGATGRGSNSEPLGGQVLQGQPGVWQTLVFNPLTDPVASFTGDGVLAGGFNKAVFEDISVVSMGSAGPYALYIDDVAQLCGLPLIKGDFNVDGRIDGLDLDLLSGCALGSKVPFISVCAAANLDGDGDVDASDFGLLQRCADVSDLPALPGCVP